MSYQGWSNYETWAVKLWLDNEEPAYRYWNETTREVWEGADGDSSKDKSEDARITLAERLKSEIEDSAPDLGGSLWGDLLTAAMGEVDWFEIADAFLGDMDEGDYKSREAV